MAHQSQFHNGHLAANAHRIRAARDARANDPTATEAEREFRKARLHSPLMAREHDSNIVPVPGYEGIIQGELVMREAAAHDAEDVAHFYPETIK